MVGGGGAWALLGKDVLRTLLSLRNGDYGVRIYSLLFGKKAGRGGETVGNSGLLSS